MSWKQITEDYFTFSKKERLAGICLLLLVATLYLIPKTVSKSAHVDLQLDSNLLNQINQKQDLQPSREADAQNVSTSFYEPTVNKGFTEGALFQFDPNTLPAEGWQKLGLNTRTIKTLLNYRNKGGRFYKKEDLKKIWGLPPAFYDRVENFIELQENQQNYADNYSAPIYNTNPSKGKRNISAVHVNSADTSALIDLPGIGSKLASRIINFRDRLGGFISTEQIGETYGLPDSTFQLLKPYLQVDASAVKKIKLNTATKDELKMHPYLKWALANAIVEYRNQHGAFENVDELKNIMLIDEATFKRLAPYFSL